MTLYGEIVLGTAICATAVVLLFLLLVLRRHLSERSRAQRDERDTAITRSYLQRIAGHKTDSSDIWRRKDRRAAISRILPLLRGEERTRLLQIAELDGVLAETIRVSHSLRSGERINAIQSLQRFGSEVCIGRLREMMARDRNEAVRIEAAFALGAHFALPPPREILRILNSLQRSPSRLDTALLRSCAPFFPDQMLLLLDEDLPITWRPQIIDALGWTNNVAVADVLKAHADNPNTEVRCAVLRASGRLGHPTVQGLVLHGLKDPISAVRLQAIAATVRLNLQQALPELTQLRDDQHLWVRLRAEQAVDLLERIGGRSEKETAS